MIEGLYLIPIALALGAAGLGAFLWALRSDQYDDLDGAAERILFDDDKGPTGRGLDQPRHRDAPPPR